MVAIKPSLSANSIGLVQLLLAIVGAATGDAVSSASADKNAGFCCGKPPVLISVHPLDAMASAIRMVLGDAPSTAGRSLQLMVAPLGSCSRFSVFVSNALLQFVET